MSVPRLLLVDDSEAILAFEQAALSAHYACTTASNGQEALDRLREDRFAAVLLDISMPVLDGEAVLERMRADPALACVPVIMVSSERERAEACRALGAAEALPKPLRAPELLATVARVLESQRLRTRAGRLALLPVGIGPLELGLPLGSVRLVLLMPATRPLPNGRSYVSRFFELHGEPVPVLDLARRLGVEHAEPLLHRKLVVLEVDSLRLAVSVDRVSDPEVLDPSRVTPVERFGPTDLLSPALSAVTRGETGVRPVVEARALLSRPFLRELARFAGGSSG